MTARKPAPAASGRDEVDAFMKAFDHPKKAEMEALRAIIRDADPAIAEGIKWNGPSFRCNEYFATFHTRPRDFVHVILHRGAKVRDGKEPVIDDPAGMLERLGPDRCAVKFRDLDDIRSRQAALEHIVRQWIADLR